MTLAYEREKAKQIAKGVKEGLKDNKKGNIYLAIASCVIMSLN